MKSSMLQGEKITKRQNNLAGISLFILLSAFLFTALSETALAANDNLILNPSVEISSGANPPFPQDWYANEEGNNESSFIYPVSGLNNGQAIQVQVRQRTSGWAGWSFQEVAVKPNTQYIFSDYYKSSAKSVVKIKFKLANNHYKTVDLGELTSSASWTKAEYTFTTPADTLSVTIFHLLDSDGDLSTDEYSLAEKVILPPPPPPMPNGNLIQNPSFEESDANGQPVNWLKNIWLNNNAQFIYPVAGYNSAKAAKIMISNYVSGDAKWFFADVPVEAGRTYEFSDYYLSDVKSNITFRFLTNDNVYTYKGIEDLAPTLTWKKYTKQIQIPANVKALTLFHIIESVGFLTVDEYSLKDITVPAPNVLTFPEGMVTLSFDDARMSQYKVSFPILQAAGFKGTFYPHIIDLTDMETSSFYHPEEMLEMQAAGHEIGAHTRTHAHLASLAEPEMRNEIEGSRADLLGFGATPVNSFNYPYGEYNNMATQIVKEAGYTNARSVKSGYNLKNTDKFALLVQDVGALATIEQIKSWVDKARNDKSWLILMFHQIDYSGNKNGTTPEIFKAIVDYLASINTKVVTINEGVGLMNQ